MESMGWVFLLMGVAVGLVTLDLFIPSHGVLTLMAAVAAVGAIGLAFSVGLRQGVMMVALVGVLTPVLAGVAIKWWPHTPIGRLIILSPPDHSADGISAAESEAKGLVGSLGTAKTDLLPNGAIVVAGKTWDALTQGKSIDSGTPVKIISVRTGRLVVRSATPDDLAAAAKPTDETTLLAQSVEDWDFDED